MQSAILTQIGLGNIDPGYILIGLTAAIIILLIVLIVENISINKLKKKYEKFMRGKDAESLESEIFAIFEENKMLKASSDKNRKDIKTIYKRLETTFQKVGIVKYDAFNQMGGQLSFSLVLLDENNNGFILNSVHSSDGCYTYTKEIKEGQCAISLGEEEKKALDMAIGTEY